MKKAFLPFLIALFTSSLLSAQSDRGAKFGFHVSPGVSWFNPDMEDVANGGRVSFGFGAMADIPILDNIALSTGLGGNFNGGSMNFPSHAVPVADTSGGGGNAYLGEGTFKLRYIQVPITFKGMTNEIGHMTYFLEFGGSVGFNYRARMDMNNTKTVGSFETQEDYSIKRMIRAFRASMLIRAGAEYNMTGSTNLVFGLTFDNGLTNTFNPNNVPTFESNEDNLPRRDNNGDLVPSEKMQAITNGISVNVGVLF